MQSVGNVMSWSSKALPWIIPSVFATASQSSSIVIVSPWIDDVELLVNFWTGRHTLSGSVLLTDTMLWLHGNRNNRFIAYVREDQITPETNSRLARVMNRASSAMEIRSIPHLHAKLLITNKVIVETSANLLTYSIHRNVESLSIRHNPFQDALAFANDFTGRHG
jgi:hypothetical protein